MSRYPKNVIDICDHQPQGTLECDCINSDVEEEKITKPQPDKSRNPKMSLIFVITNHKEHLNVIVLKLMTRMKN